MIKKLLGRKFLILIIFSFLSVGLSSILSVNVNAWAPSLSWEPSSSQWSWFDNYISTRGFAGLTHADINYVIGSYAGYNVIIFQYPNTNGAGFSISGPSIVTNVAGSLCNFSNQSCNTPNNPFSTSTGSSSVQFDSVYSVHLMTYPIPEGLPYTVTGDMAEDLYPPPPEISYQIIDDEGTFNAINIPETGVSGIKWLITYGTIEGDPQLHTWEASDIPTKPLIYTFPYIAKKGTDDKYGTYLITAYYFDENEERISEESIITVILRDDQYNYFNGTCSGETCMNNGAIGNNAVSLNFDDCTFRENFPYLDITACKNKIGEMLGLLNFGKIRYGSQFKGDTTGCHTLTTIGTWLMQPSGTVVCPKISQEIRNTVTPFIVFALGLVMIQFIAKRGTDQGV